MRPVTFLVGALIGGAIGATVTAGVALTLAAGATGRLPGQTPRPLGGVDRLGRRDGTTVTGTAREVGPDQTA